MYDELLVNEYYKISENALIFVNIALLNSSAEFVKIS